MKKLLLLSMLVLASAIVFAQRDGNNADARVAKKMTHLTEKLDLSVEQQAKVKDLLVSQQSMRKANRKKSTELSQTDRAAISEKREASEADFNTKMATILSAEQLATFKNLPKKGGKPAAQQAKVKEKSQFGSHGNGTNRSIAEKVAVRVNKMTTQLDLTPVQQKQMTGLLIRQQQKRQNVKVDRANMSEADKAAMKAERKAGSAAHKAELEEILTPVQLAKYKESMAERKGKGKMQPKVNKQKRK